MATFAQLPTELQEQIIKDLDTGDLSSFSRTCTCLRYANLPFLYRDISITWTRGEQMSSRAKVLRSLLENDSLSPLVRQLHLHAQAVVQSSSSTADATDTFPDNILDIRSNQDHPISHALLQRAVQESQLPDNDKWVELMTQRPLDVAIALAILRCTNLEWLDVDAGLLADNTAFTIAIENLYQTIGKSDDENGDRGDNERSVTSSPRTTTHSHVQHFLQLMRRKYDKVVPGGAVNYTRSPANQASHTHVGTQSSRHRFLKRVDIATSIKDRRTENERNEWGVHMRVLLACLHFPALEELQLNFLAPTWACDSTGRAFVDEGWDDARNLPGATSLTSLQLIATSIAPKGLEKILSLMPALLYLDYDYFAHGYEQLSKERDWSLYGTLRGPDLRHALDRVCGTLQHLKVSMFLVVHGNDPLELFPYCWVYKAVGSLKELHSLRSLDIPLPILCGDAQNNLPLPPLASLLPENLEELYLIDELEDGSLFLAYDADEFSSMVQDFVAGYQMTNPRLKKLKLSCEIMDWRDEDPEKIKELCNRCGLDCELLSWHQA